MFLSIGTLGMMIGAITVASRRQRGAQAGADRRDPALQHLPDDIFGQHVLVLAIRLLTGIGLGAALPTIISVAAEGVSGRRDLTVGIFSRAHLSAPRVSARCGQFTDQPVEAGLHGRRPCSGADRGSHPVAVAA